LGTVENILKIFFLLGVVLQLHWDWCHILIHCSGLVFVITFSTFFHLSTVMGGDVEEWRTLYVKCAKYGRGPGLGCYP
jgi:hypothetical protein